MRLKCNSVGSIGSAKSYGGPNKQRSCDSRSRCLLEQTPWQTSTTIDIVHLVERVGIESC